MEIRYTVFICSTYNDLIAERQEVIKTILDLGHIPISMEHFPHSDATEKLIEYKMSLCDYCIIIMGGYYGDISKNNISFCEMEYDYARSLDIPLLFYLKENYMESSSFVKNTRSQAARLKKFIKKLQRHHNPKLWRNSGTLVQSIPEALKITQKLFPRPGYIRGAQVCESSWEQFSYVGLYYSFNEHRPHQFKFNIKIDQYKNVIGETIGFRDHLKSSDVLNGKGRTQQKYLFFDLTNSEGYPIKISLILGDTNIRELLDTSGSVFGHYIRPIISGKTGFYSGELVLIKYGEEDERDISFVEKIQIIKKYLMVNRCVSRVWNRSLKTADSWNTDLSCRQINVNSLNHLVGSYCILIPISNKKGLCVVSRLEISADLQIRLFTKNEKYKKKGYPEEQVCLIRSSSIITNNTDKLNLTLHHKRGVRVVSNVIIDLPTDLDIIQRKVLVGSYCAINPIHKIQENSINKTILGSRSGFVLVLPCEKEIFNDFVLGEKSYDEVGKTSSISKMLYYYLEQIKDEYPFLSHQKN